MGEQKNKTWFISDDGYKFEKEEDCLYYENNALAIKNEYCPGCYVYWNGKVYDKEISGDYNNIPKEKIDKPCLMRIKRVKNIRSGGKVILCPFGINSNAYIKVNVSNIMKTEETDRINKSIIDNYKKMEELNKIMFRTNNRDKIFVFIKGDDE